MKRIPGVAGRPYPNVQGWRRDRDGTVVYEAQYQYRNQRGRRCGKHLGTFANPLRAHYEVVNERANAAEKRAKVLRAEADQILSDLVRMKSSVA